MNGRYTKESWLIFAAVLVVVGIVVFATGARSHSWYPMECCSGEDCAEVTSTAFTTPVSTADLPQLVVTTKMGTAIVPYGFKFRESKDGRMHACMKTYDRNPSTRLLCLFVPPTT